VSKRLDLVDRPVELVDDEVMDGPVGQLELQAVAQPT